MIGPRTLAAVRVLVVFVAWFKMGTVCGQSPPRSQSPFEVLKAAQAASSDIEQLRSALHSPDPSVRMTTYIAMVESNNASLVATAINEGHVSADPVLRDLAARAAVRELSTVIFEPATAFSPEVQEQYQKSPADGGPHLRIEKYDWRSGQMQVYSGRLQVSGTTLAFDAVFCHGSLGAVEGTWTYQGLVSCANGPGRFSGDLKVRIR